MCVCVPVDRCLLYTPWSESAESTNQELVSASLGPCYAHVWRDDFHMTSCVMVARQTYVAAGLRTRAYDFFEAQRHTEVCATELWATKHNSTAKLGSFQFGCAVVYFFTHL